MNARPHPAGIAGLRVGVVPARPAHQPPRRIVPGLFGYAHTTHSAPHCHSTPLRYPSPHVYQHVAHLGHTSPPDGHSPPHQHPP
ncbi:MAG: hypothetical protein U1U88_001319 [Lawsonella clevelandensis]